MRDRIATVDGRRCQFSYIILSRVGRLGVILLMHRTARFPKPANRHRHAISERSWVDNTERCRSCLRASCRRRAFIKCSPVFSFGLCWCDAREVCGPSAANVHVKEYIFACPCAVRVSRRIWKDTVSLIFSRLLLMLVPRVVVIVRRTPWVLRSLDRVLENLRLQAEVWYSMIVVNALSLFTLHGSASVPDDATF
jgi:hypothetical protein